LPAQAEGTHTCAHKTQQSVSVRHTRVRAQDMRHNRVCMSGTQDWMLKRQLLHGSSGWRRCSGRLLMGSAGPACCARAAGSQRGHAAAVVGILSPATLLRCPGRQPELRQNAATLQLLLLLLAQGICCHPPQMLSRQTVLPGTAVRQKRACWMRQRQAARTQ
jgi:hypothetical protein